MSEQLHATCECGREMTEGGACAATHISKGGEGPWVARVKYGDEPDDWGAADGHNCHDCNVAPNEPHHFGCDVERCPGCGRQMLSCECPWEYLGTAPRPAISDPVVKVVWKDEGDFGFITLVRLSDMDGHDPATTTWLEVLAERAARARARGQSLGVPFDPDRKRPAGTREQALALAREHNATLEEV